MKVNGTAVMKDIEKYARESLKEIEAY